MNIFLFNIKNTKRASVVFYVNVHKNAQLRAERYLTTKGNTSQQESLFV